MSKNEPQFIWNGIDIFRVCPVANKPVGSGTIYLDRSCRNKEGSRRCVWRAELSFNGIRIRKRSHSRAELEDWLDNTRDLWLRDFLSGDMKPTKKALIKSLLCLKEKLKNPPQ